MCTNKTVSRHLSTAHKSTYTYAIAKVYLKNILRLLRALQQVFHSKRHTLRFWTSPAIFPPFGGQSETLHFVRTVVQSGKAVKWYSNALLRSILKTCLRKPSLLWITGFRGLDLQETQKSHLLQESQCDLIYLTSLWWLDTSPSKLQMVDKITVLFQWYQINVSDLSKHWILAIYSIVLVERDKTHICELGRNHPWAGATFNKHLHILSSPPYNAWKHT